MREVPPGSNRGWKFDRAVRLCGLDPEKPARTGRRGYSYCSAMVCLWFHESADLLLVPNPCPIAARVVDLYRRTPDRYRIKDPRPGAVFIHLTDLEDPDSHGHTGLVEDVIVGTPGSFISIEANTGAEGDTDPNADMDGDGVRGKRRPLEYANAGYLYFG